MTFDTRVASTATSATQLDRVSRPSTIELENVRKVYGAGPFAKLVVDECSFTVEAGKVTVLIGPSGCGKSTVAFLVAGYESTTDGTIRLDGKPIDGPSRERLMVFQESALLPWMTTLENVMFGPRANGVNARRARTRARALLERVGLADFANKYPTQLSGGMQRRAELARALINEPKLMVLDEPFRGLDDMTRGLMQEYFNEIFEETRRTGLFITTDIDEAIYLADRVVIMSNVPTRAREVIDVDLPRPRNRTEVLTSPRAYEIKRHALDLLHDEARKSFAAGNQAAADFVEAYAARTNAVTNKGNS